MSAFSSKVAWNCPSQERSCSPRFSAHNGRVSEQCCWRSAANTLGTQYFHVMSQCTNKSLSFRKIERAFLHREKENRPTNVIFYLLFSVGWCWIFCSWHTLVNQSCQDTSCFDFSLQLPLVPPVLTADVPLILMSILWEGSSLPMGFLLHAAGLSLYLKINK